MSSHCIELFFQLIFPEYSIFITSGVRNLLTQCWNLAFKIKIKCAVLRSNYAYFLFSFAICSVWYWLMLSVSSKAIHHLNLRNDMITPTSASEENRYVCSHRYLGDTSISWRYSKEKMLLISIKFYFFVCVECKWNVILVRHQQPWYWPSFASTHEKLIR